MDSVNEEMSPQDLKKDYEAHIEKLRKIFNDVFRETCKLDHPLEDFKKQQIPIARIKKVMKTDEDVNMVSNDAPVIMAKACELFIIDLAFRSQFFCKKSRRKIMSVHLLEG